MIESPKLVVVLSGAGLSVESGVPTFRASDGLWAEHKIEDVATPGGWKRDKAKVLNFYAKRMENVLSCQPNLAHLAFAHLESEYKVIHITQNVDDLLERAGCKNVIHMHGSLFKRKCENYEACNYRAEQQEPVKLGDLCPNCNSQLRPDIVWFEEAVQLDMAYVYDLADVDSVDTLIVVGTSLNVYPAADLIITFERAKNKYLVDPNPPFGTDCVLYADEAGIAVPKLVRKLLNE